MARIQQSIEIKVPVHTAYNQLTQFEDYPQFMEEVEAVKQLDDAHLHWKTLMANQPVEWDAEITEQEPDRCIAWHNTSGPMNAGRVEVQSVAEDVTRITFIMQAEPQHAHGAASGSGEEEMKRRLKSDLERLKDFMEARGSETGAWRGEIQDGEVTVRDRDARGDSTAQPAQGDRGSPRNSPVPTSAYAAGAEDMPGAQAAAAPVTSTSRTAAEQRNSSAGSVSSQQKTQPQQAATSTHPGAGRPQVNKTTQSDYSLSQSPEEQPTDGRYSVAEEVNFDQQSDKMRHVGQMPQDTTAEAHGGTPTSDAMGKALKQDDGQEEKDDAKLKPSMDRSVPPSA